MKKVFKDLYLIILVGLALPMLFQLMIVVMVYAVINKDAEEILKHALRRLGNKNG